MHTCFLHLYWPEAVNILQGVHVCMLDYRELLPGAWDIELDSFQKLLILRCLRADCLVQGLQDFVSAHLGQRFIEPQVGSSTLFRWYIH